MTSRGGGRPVGDAARRTNWIRHEALAHVFRRVAEALAAEGVPVVPVKGLITSRVLYDDIANRPIADVDLRVRPGDVARAVAVGRRQGWQPKTDMPVLGQILYDVGGAYVDVESTLGPPGLCAISVDDVIRRGEARVDPFGAPYVWPAFTDHALILALNVFKDGMRTPEWSIEDLRRLPEHRDFDVDALVRRAADGGVRSALWLIADWMSEERGCSAWRAVRDAIGREPPNRIAGAAFRALRRRGWSPKMGLLVTACAADRPLDGARGAALTLAGVLRRRVIKMVDRLEG